MTKLYTLTELESVLGLSHVTLLSYVKQGKLKATKLGGTGKWKVTEDDLKAFIAGNTPAPSDTKTELKAFIDDMTEEQAIELHKRLVTAQYSMRTAND